MKGRPKQVFKFLKDPINKFKRMSVGNTTEEMVKSLLRGHARHEDSRKTAMKADNGILGILTNFQRAIQGFGAESFSWLGAWIIQFFAYTASKGLLRMLPYISGLSLCIAFSAYPFTVFYCVLSGSLKPLLNYVKYLFWVKSWCLLWAIVHYASFWFAKIQATVAPETGVFWEKPYFNIATSAFIIMTPVISLIFINGVMSGVSDTARSATLWGDKGTGIAGGAVKGAV
jgi:hypothetical protein